MIKTKPTHLLTLSLLSLLLISCNATKEVVQESESLEPIEQTEEKRASLFKKLEENNHLPVQERIALYYTLKKEHFNDYNFESDRELNQYGYSLLTTGKTDEAIEIFKLLVSEFPNESNPYDSLGEAYLAAGDEDLALVNYEKSVALNPKNYWAADQINRIKGLELLVTDWGKEIFHFPIHFAPEIPYEGVEEVVFPKNWIKPDSTDFWSYVFVWAIENETAVTVEELEANLELYFDGLNDDVSEDEMIYTSAHFETNSDPKDSVTFTGKVKLFDHFATNEELNLNARIYSSYCEENQKLILLFRFSPLDFDQPIWDKLRTVGVRETVCEE